MLIDQLTGQRRRDRLHLGVVYLLAAAVLLEGMLVLASGRVAAQTRS